MENCDFVFSEGVGGTGDSTFGFAYGRRRPFYDTPRFSERAVLLSDGKLILS